MGRRSNRMSEEWVSEKWAVGIMGCPRPDPQNIIWIKASAEVHIIFWGRLTGP